MDEQIVTDLKMHSILYCLYINTCTIWSLQEAKFQVNQNIYYFMSAKPAFMLTFPNFSVTHVHTSLNHVI